MTGIPDTLAGSNAPVREIMTQPPACADEDTPLDEVFKQMSDRNIGSMMITRSGALVGIISERDCLRLWDRESKERCGRRPVKEFMTPNPATVQEDISSDWAYEIMHKGGFRHMPVLRGTELVGMVSLRDVAKCRTYQLEQEKDQLHTLLAVAKTVSKSIEVRRILKEIIQYIQHLLHADRASVLILGKDRRMIHLFRRDTVAADPETFKRLNADEYPVLRRLFQKDICFYEKSDDPELFQQLVGLLEMPPDSRIVIIPIVLMRESMGLIVAALSLSAPAPSDHFRLTSGVLETCRAVAMAAGNAIYNSQLYDDLLAAYEDLKNEIAERKRLEAVMDKVTDLDRMASLGRLAAGVAHEMKNALTGVIGMAELLKHGQNSGDEIDTILQEAARAVKIAQDLLSFARPQPLKMQPVDLAGIVRQIVRIAGNDLKNHHVSMQISAPEQAPNILADESQIHQVILNLIINARDAMPAGGRIDVGIHCEGDEIVADVADSGSGIPPEILPRIFEPFFSTKQRGKGTGLGLSVVNGIVMAHGGTIAASNRPEGGAVFRLRLPRAAKSSESGAGRPGAVPFAGPHGLSILVVDDERSVREVCGRLLEKLGNHVVQAAGAEEADQALENKSFDVILCDHTLSRKDGLEFHRTLRQSGRPEANRFILMTGLAPEQIRTEVKVLYKPLDFELMMKEIADMAVEEGGRS